MLSIQPLGKVHKSCSSKGSSFSNVGEVNPFFRKGIKGPPSILLSIQLQSSAFQPMPVLRLASCAAVLESSYKAFSSPIQYIALPSPSIPAIPTSQASKIHSFSSRFPAGTKVQAIHSLNVNKTRMDDKTKALKEWEQTRRAHTDRLRDDFEFQF
uniref:Uncharacterized protein n=1 Tax=Utricularia reniformis TaxID=192314 RepID=A0A1Y0B2I8_9LAMI|nr:hypothetical protein AEK19_MT1373 [Utricularia reniformis]ART31569.1 hypothetical protein AEK19_MT1373 [Utricularia reniformis]